MTDTDIQALIDRRFATFRIVGDGKIVQVRGRATTWSIEGVDQAGGSGAFVPSPGSDGSAPYGWSVLTRKISGTWKWGVFPGTLRDTQKNGATLLTVTGCLTPGHRILNADPGWSAIGTAPAKIWLEGNYTTAGWPALNGDPYINTTDYDGGAIEYATTTDGSGDTDYIQTYWRRILGEVLAFNSDGSPQLITQGLGILYLSNGGDYGYDSGNANPAAIPTIFPRA